MTLREITIKTLNSEIYTPLLSEFFGTHLTPPNTALQGFFVTLVEKAAPDSFSKEHVIDCVSNVLNEIKLFMLQKELDLWKDVNKTYSSEELETVIRDIGEYNRGFIPVSGAYKHNAEDLSSSVRGVVNGVLPLNQLTRNYGIRSRAFYIKNKYNIFDIENNG